MPKSLTNRIKESLNVSGAFDNCFFHSYVIHLLANKLPLPKDLFNFKSILGEESYASKLQAKFPDIESLSLFAEYSSLQSDEVPLSPSFIVEKTLVLGFLMREWFATKMSQTPEIAEGYKTEALAKFKSYKEFRGFMSKTVLQEAILYKANDGFLEYFTQRPTKKDLTPTEQRYEQYFLDAEENIDKAIEAYWKTEGYQNYYKRIGTPYEKLAYTDLVPVVTLQNQALTIYSHANKTITYSSEGGELPPLEITLDAGAGHYHLLKTNITSPICDEYKTSLTQYLLDRKSILEKTTDIVSAENQSSILVSAIIPPGHLEKEPFALLLDRIDTMKGVVTNHHHEANLKLQHEQRSEVLKTARDFIKAEITSTKYCMFQKYTPKQILILRTMDKVISTYQERIEKAVDKKQALLTNNEELYGLLNSSIGALNADSLERDKLITISKKMQPILECIGASFTTGIEKATKIDEEIAEKPATPTI